LYYINMSKEYYVYIVASGKNGTIYVGVTNNIQRRLWEHKNNIVNSFTSEYKVKILVYYEIYEDINTAISREKQLKKWNRKWKTDLIEKNNYEWNDLSSAWIPDLVGNDRK